MSWDKPSDAAAEAVLWGILETAAKNRKDEARAWLTNRMGPDMAAVKAVANGETIGRATWVEPVQQYTVVDPAAFMEYVGRKWATELVTTVNPAFQKTFLSGLTDVDGEAIDKDGEPVPGVALRESAPFVSVRKSPEARAAVEELLSGGQVRLDGIGQPELEAGA